MAFDNKIVLLVLAFTTFFNIASAADFDAYKKRLAVLPGRNYWPTQEWRLDDPENQGMNTPELDRAIDFIRQNDSDAFLVIKNGYMVTEWYARQYRADSLHDSYSIAKSFTNAAMGIAIKEGLLKGPSQLIRAFYLDDLSIPYNPFFDRITIHHLLSMTSGYAFDNRTDYPEMTNRKNWVNYVLNKPIKHPPGSYWRYKADPTLLSGIITKVTGFSMLEYLDQKLFRIIGIDTLTWFEDECGHSNGNGDIHTTARHYARFGFLYLNNGRWDDKQLLPSDWVALSTKPCAFSERTFCNCWDFDGRTVVKDKQLEYGYLWWCRKMNGIPEDMFYAFGGYGQFIVAIPSLDMLIVRLGHGPSRSDLTFLPDMVRMVVNAIKR